MEWHELFDSLAGRLQEGWPQVVRTIQDGDFGELLQQPAMIMAAWTRAPVSSVDNLTAPATIRIGAILATNMARTCWSPKGIAFSKEIFPSSS